MKSKFFKSILSVLMALSVLCAGNLFFFAGAQSVADLEEEAKRLEEQIKNNEKLLASIKGDISRQTEYVKAIDSQLSAMNKRVGLLGDRVDSLNSSITALGYQIESVQKEIADTEKQIEETNNSIDSVYEQLGARMRAMYMSGNASELSILLSAKDVSSLLVRSELLKRIAEHDDKLINDMISELNKLETEKKKLSEKEAELNKKMADLEAKQTELLKTKADLDSQQSAIESKYAEANGYLAALDKNSAAYKQAIKEAEAKKRIIEDKILEISNGGSSEGDGSNSSVGSSLYSPVQDPSRYISAKFGSYPSGGAHRGLDITCNSAQGKPIYAAESGTVILASYQGDLGNYVLIDHGGGVKTGYAHNSSIIVSVGQKVERGQQIAKMGNTGYSFGPHCHFVLIKNGVYVNPEPYLPSIPYRP